MTTILFAFIVSLILSLVLTPGTKRLGIRFGAIDLPAARGRLNVALRLLRITKK